MNGWTILLAGAVSLLLSVALTGPLGRLARHWNLTDRPTGYKAHGRTVPYLGGVAIMLGTIVPLVVLFGLPDGSILTIMCAAVVVCLLGLIDDVTPLSPLTRLVVETMAATGVVLSGVSVPVTGGWPDAPLTVLWIVVITNSFNLLDNMDGALGAITTAGAALLAATAFAGGSQAIGLLLTALCYAGLGFLPHNWSPAKVFMGDSGSLFIGFVLACSAALLTTGGDIPTVIAGLLLPTFVATVDTGVVLLSRARAGRPLLQGGTDHLSHRLHALGFSVRLTAATLAGTAALSGGLNLAMTLGVASPLVTAITVIAMTLILIGLPQKVRISSPGGSREAPVNISER